MRDALQPAVKFCGGREKYSAELLDRKCGSQNNSPCPQRWPPLNSCDCVILPGKRGCVDVIKLRDPEIVRLLWIIQTNATSSKSPYQREAEVAVCVWAGLEHVSRRPTGDGILEDPVLPAS